MIEFLKTDAQEAVDKVERVSGRNLIYNGVTKDANGAPILPGAQYDLYTSEIRAINHRQKIGHIIADAANMEEMHDRLAAYLVKWATSRDAVVATIPVNLLLKNKRQNDEN